jgi:hypothetical protein
MPLPLLSPRRLTGVAAMACAAALIPVAALAATTGAPAAAHPAAAVPACRSSLLTWFAPEGDGFAGGASFVVEFSNTGRAACAVKGFPTVKLTENGKQVGLNATTGGTAPATVTLTPGQTAHVALIIYDAGALCHPVPTNGLSVQPPGKTHAWDFPLVAFGACPGKSTLYVDAINPGTGIPLYTTH